jgi:hypothetical protein
MVISSGCSEEGCTVRRSTGIDGVVDVPLVVLAPREDPVGQIVLGYDDNASLETARVGVRLVASGDVAPRRTPTPTPSPSPSAEPRTTTTARNLVLIGDSLAVGMKPYLETFLEGWTVTVDAALGRRLGDGMRRISQTPDPGVETVYAFSLFTNDDPSGVALLESSVRTSRERGCVVWATIARPPVTGVSFAEANAALRRLAARGRVLVVPWSEQTRAHPDWLVGDRVHATATGYRERARLFAEAVRGCG